MQRALRFGGLLLLTLATPGHAEVFCQITKFRINTYIYGMPAIENPRLPDGGQIAPLSLCGNECNDAATQQRLALAMSAQARGVPLWVYFGDKNQCSEIKPYDKPYGISVYP